MVYQRLPKRGYRKRCCRRSAARRAHLRKSWESLIRERADVLAVWVEVTKRPSGNLAGTNQHTKKEDSAGGTLYNVQGSSMERPTGNTAAAGLRKLQKAAAEGNEKAPSFASSKPNATCPG